jgi:hypothetical protein
MDIEWVDGVGKSSVTVRKGSETAKLEFNEAVVHGPPQGATPPTGPAKGPTVSPPPAGMVRPPMPAATGPAPMQNQRANPMPRSTPPAIKNRVLPQPATLQGPGGRSVVPLREGTN